MVQGGGSTDAVATMRAAATVAIGLREARVGPVLTATAAEHAAAVARAAATTLAALQDQGWRAVVDQPLGVAAAANIGAEAVAERTETFDPLSVEVSPAA